MTLPAVTWTTSYLTNSAYGFPTGKPRRVDPVALLCVHITDNRAIPPATAVQERTYANRANSGGPSAHYYLDRAKYGGVAAVDWRRFAAWSNGDVRSPKTAVPGVQAVVDMRAAGYNANEAYWIEAESCGSEPSYPITAKQISTLAMLAAEASRHSGLAISRATIHAHSDLNTETRASCPTAPAKVEALLAQVIAEAQQYLNEMIVTDLQTMLAASAAALETANAKADALALEVSRLTADVKVLTEAREIDWTAWEAYSDAMKQRVAGALALDPPVRA